MAPTVRDVLVADVGPRDVELLEVVCHERYTIGGGDITSEEFLKWCSPTGEGFLAVESGGFEAAGVSTEPGSNPVG